MTINLGARSGPITVNANRFDDLNRLVPDK